MTFTHLLFKRYKLASPTLREASAERSRIDGLQKFIKLILVHAEDLTIQ
jgi:hypothetical protein